MSTVLLVSTKQTFRVSKIICIGRNYAEHAREMKADVPTSPVLFLKPPSAIIHDKDHVIIPPFSREMHHEVEMTVLIGKRGQRIPREQAMDHVAGYGVGLDMTLRDVQTEAKKKGLPWSVAKGFDTSAPLSAFVGRDAVRDPHGLSIELTVGGATRQRGNTRDFIFRLDQLISAVSDIFTLEEGDVIFTGTPQGVGPVSPGDVLEARVSEDGTTLASIRVDVQGS